MTCCTTRANSSPSSLRISRRTLCAIRRNGRPSWRVISPSQTRSKAAQTSLRATSASRSQRHHQVLEMNHGLLRSIKAFAAQSDRLAATMARKVDDMREHVIQPIDKVLKCRGWPLLHLDQLTIFRPAQRLLNLANFSVKTKITVGVRC